MHGHLRNIHPSVWVGEPDSLPADTQTKDLVISSGFRALDQELPHGGWPKGVLTELLVRHMGVGELRFLAPTLRTLTQAGRHIVLLAPPHTPYAPAFDAMGIDCEKLLVLNAQRPVDRLWAVEQSLKSGQFGALITWLGQDDRAEALSAMGLASIRRLQLAAAKTAGLAFVFRPWSAQKTPSPAPLRMLLLPRRYPELAVQIIKRRGPMVCKPIDIAIAIPGSGLRQIQESQAIVSAPTQQALSVTTSPTRQHAVDRQRHSTALSGALPPAPAASRPALRH